MKKTIVEDSFDTTRLAAFYRAQESQRQHARFHDPYARRLAGERGEWIARHLPPGAAASWGIVLRTCIYDELLLQLLQQEQIDTVINLGAGLDTRPYRMDLPESLRWIEVDLPEILAYKQMHLSLEKPRCKLEQFSFDITDHTIRSSFLTEVCQETQQVLVLTEGVLIYLTAQQVISLVNDLHEHQSLRWWLTEYVSPQSIKRDECTWNKLAGERARRFAPSGGITFFEQYGWKVAEFQTFFEAALRLKISMPFGWLLKILSRLAPRNEHTEETMKKAGGFVLLERAVVESLENETSIEHLPSSDLLEKCDQSIEEDCCIDTAGTASSDATSGSSK